MTETRTLPILRAVDAAVAAVRARHENIPEVVVVLGAPGKTRRGQIHGHFANFAWRDAQGKYTHEILLSGESLNRGGRQTLGTIIHELAHAQCFERKIQDTSNGGRYHNRKFKEVAESLGLEISSAPTIGHSVTTVPDSTASEYRAEIEALDAAITVYRSWDKVAEKKPVKKYIMQCPECEDPVPTTKKWFYRNEFRLKCDAHDSPFEFIEKEEA